MSTQEAVQKRSIGVPNLPGELLSDQERKPEHSTATIPPFLSTTESLVTEISNSDPRFMRSTLYVLPSSEYYLETSGIPFAVMAAPFSEQGLCMSAARPGMCGQCRTYFNCFTKKLNGKLLCNVCGYSTDMSPSSEFDTLHLPTFEFLSGENPSALDRPAFIFVFDFTLPGIDELVRQAVKICQDESFSILYGHVAFVVLNHGISIFSKGSAGKHIVRHQIFGEPPHLSKALFIKTTETELMAEILEMISEERINLKPDLLSYFMSMLHTLSKSFLGIKVAIMTRVKSTNYNYEVFLEKANNIMIDIITEKEEETIEGKTAQNTVFRLAFHSGGRVSRFRRNEVMRMACELHRIALTRTAFRVSMIMKVSDNIVKSGVLSPALEENLSVTQLNGMESPDAVTFQLSLSGLSKNTKYCQVQVFYTNNQGERLVRVLNHAFAIGNLQQFYAGMAFDTIFAVLCKIKAAEGIHPENALIKALSLYRQKCSGQPSSSQLVLPDSLKCLPVLVQAMDKRSMPSMMNIITLGVEQLVKYFYPRMISLVDFASSNSQLQVTCGTRLSLSSLNDADLYVMENGDEIYIYIPQDAEQLLVDTLFCKLDDPAAQDGYIYGAFGLRSANTQVYGDVPEECHVLNDLIGQIISHYSRNMPIRVIMEGMQPDDALFLGSMVEDAVNNRPDYVDYIFKLHFKVQKT